MPRAPKFVSTKSVQAYWIRKQGRDLEVFTAIPGSFVPNPERKSLRFQLRKIDGYNDTYQVVIRQVRGYYRYKAEWYEEPAEEHELTALELERGLELYDNDEADLVFIEMGW
ncbi:MAG: hypothetical protein H0X11_02335 [Betaproteobacteria bacterium]|nr:hypothetical protein [Betaproteobacteria bacterium]